MVQSLLSSGEEAPHVPEGTQSAVGISWRAERYPQAPPEIFP